MPNLLVVRLTHTGIFPGGRPNVNPIFIPDLDTGLENQDRKVPVYVPYGGFIDIPLSSRSLLSASSGAIAKFVAAGFLTATYTNNFPGGGGGGGGGTVVWRPGDPTVPDSHYDTFPEAYDAAIAMPGHVWIDWDTSLGNAEVPIKLGGGPWDFEGRIGFRTIRFLGVSDEIQMSIEDGAQILNLYGFDGMTRVAGLGTAVSPLIFDPSPFNVIAPPGLILTNGAKLRNSGTVPLVQLGAGEKLFVLATNLGGFLGSPTGFADITGGAVLQIAALTGSSFDSGFVTGDALSTLFFIHDATTNLPSIPGFAGTVVHLFGDLAQNIAYSPGTPGDWAGSPLTIAEALDRIASVVATLNGAPIP